YSALHLSGYNLSLEELKRFRQWESLTPGHPELHHTPGIEVTTGPLGQGFANGVGFAIAERFLAERYNRPFDEIVDHRVYCICSDGDLMEGVSNEAASIAGTLGLGKLIYYYDDNNITIDGTTWISFTEDRGARFEAQGWHVQHVHDANDLDALREATANAQAETQKPSLIVVRSHIGYGAPHAVDTAKAHGAPLGEDEVRAAKQALGWDPDKKFYVPDEVREHMNVTERGVELEDAWQTKLSAWSAKYPALREDWDQVHTGKPRPGWIEALPEFEAGEELATRDVGAKAMEAFKRFTPTMIGGAADLVESTKTEFKGGGLFSATHAGRNIPFGIREHAMGSIVNGISLHNGMLKPYGSTFLIFSDYMRPAVRLSALSKLQSMWVWTHDSVGLGEDGPTHQPVEHYAALRAIPFLWFIRPADATETVGAWKAALEREDGPVALALTRQKVPTLEGTSHDGVARGAYVVWESDDANGLPDLILIATGSEVHVAVDAAKQLDEQGMHARVVSMPCWELFEAQPREYRDDVLLPDVKARLSVEAGVGLGWKQWVGDEGDSISIEHFGASAPGNIVLEKFGYTVDNVVARALALRTRVS
ncbi:MAG: transketolase, partial [Actinomycetota bacterium]|nr:transketolase [Actinomycetota bacterium]